RCGAPPRSPRTRGPAHAGLARRHTPPLPCRLECAAEAAKGRNGYMNSSRIRVEDEAVTDSNGKERTSTMLTEISPIAVRPWTLNGISERMIVSHYENNYGGVVRTLNAVRREIAALDGVAAPDRLRALRQEELRAMNAVELHERYFANLGGEGRTNVGLAGARTDQMPDAGSTIIEEHFGSVPQWRRGLRGAARSLARDSRLGP